MKQSRYFAAALSYSTSAWSRSITAALVASLTGLVIAVVPASGDEPASAVNPADITPPWGTFPQPGAGIDLAGELVVVDHVNRRFGLRLDGDFNGDRYGTDSKLKATLLPYAEVWYHAALADLADIPLGTRLHGRFLLPPKDAPPRELTTTERKYPPPPHDRALVVEDGFSHQRRRGQAFRIDAVDIKRAQYGYGDALFTHDRGTIAFSQVKASGQPLDGPSDMPKDATYTLDASTRVWKNGRAATLADLAVGQVVQANLGWAPGWQNRQFHCLDLWIDDESCTTATEQQRRVHVRRMLHYRVPGWIDHVEYEPDGSGVLTITLFSGMDKQVVDEINVLNPFRYVDVVDDRLRGFHSAAPGGHVIKRGMTASPPPGSSGITHQIHVSGEGHLAGFRPGRFVRVGLQEWPAGNLPPETKQHFHLPPEPENPLD